MAATHTPGREPSLRAIRTAYTIVITTLGVAAVAAAVVSDPSRSASARFSIALVGVILVHSASWRRSNPFLPNERRAQDLRTEVEGLLASVRRLGGLHSDASGAEDVNRVVESMHSAVDRIAALAPGSAAVEAPGDADG